MKHPIFLLMVVGLILILAIPIGIAMMAAIGVVMPGFLVAFVVWAYLAAGRRQRHRRWSRHQWRSHPAQPFQSQHSSAPVPASSAANRQDNQADLPIDVQVRVEQIRRKAEVLLGFATSFPPFSKDLFIVRRTATDYLPRTIDAYLALPEGSADRLVPATGRTALDELRQQLELLDGKLDEIANDLQRRDFDGLLANRRFLEERFGRTSA